MTLQEALASLEAILPDRCLTDTQMLVFQECWAGQTYTEIAANSGYDPSYVKDVGSKLWQLLSEALDERVTKNNLQSVLRRYQQQQDQVRPDQADLNPNPSSELATNLVTVGTRSFSDHKLLATGSTDQPFPTQTLIDQSSQTAGLPRVDWGESWDVSAFYGRTQELDLLRQWIAGTAASPPCRLLSLLGMGGMGKTTLSIKLMADALKATWAAPFSVLIWRSLRHAPTLRQMLADLIYVLSNQQEPESALSEDVNGRIARLMHYLQTTRCFLVLDNLETLLQGETASGDYRPGYEDYGELLTRIASQPHQSCVILTSREKPKQVVLLEGDAVRSLQLSGLPSQAGRQLVEAKGSYTGSAADWQTLVEHYSGNPLALKMVAPAIRDLFNGDLSQFIGLIDQDLLVFGDMRDLLDRQFQRLSPNELEVMYWLAINRELVPWLELREDLLSTAAKAKLPETLQSLSRRALLEKQSNAFTQQSVVMEYMTEQLIEQLLPELLLETEINLCNRYALIKATSKDYIRASQTQSILSVIAQRLRAALRPVAIADHLQRLLQQLQSQFADTPGYAAGNLINLLCHCKIDLTDYSFAHLAVWQAYLPGVRLKRVNFTDANLAKSLFSEVLGLPLTIAFSPDGSRLAIGDANGQIHIWHAQSLQKLFTCAGHTGWVWSVAFSPDGQSLISGSEDTTLKLWDLQTGACRQTFSGHSHRIWSVAFSPNGQTVASGSEDCTIKLWPICPEPLQPTHCCQTLIGHTNWVRAIAFSPTEAAIASASSDTTVKIWHLASGDCRHTLTHHSSCVWAIDYSPDGQTIASSSNHSIKLSNVATGECLQSFQGHTNGIRAVRFSPDGQQLASGSEDQTIRLWNVTTGECSRILRGHQNWVRSLTFHPQAPIFASASGDNTIKLWHSTTGQCQKTLQGYLNRVWAVAYHPAGQTLASCSDDHALRLWHLGSGSEPQILRQHTHPLRAIAYSRDGQRLAIAGGDHKIHLLNSQTGDCLQTFSGHSDWIWSVAWSPDQQWLASGSSDCTVKIWSLATGQCEQTLQGHGDRIWSVAYSPDGQRLASGSEDHTLKLWDCDTGTCLQTLAGDANWVWTVAFSPDGKFLASGGGNHQIHLWHPITGDLIQTLSGHTNRIWSIAFHPQLPLLASSSSDHTLKLWDLERGSCLQTLTGHTNIAWTVAFSPVRGAYGQQLASGSQDETIKLWDLATATCLQTLKTPLPYDGMTITNVSGLTEAQKISLKHLGAIGQG
jgi:WD40 repeat protein